MEKQIFKVGDKVFDIRHGWGKIIFITKLIPFPVKVKFENTTEDYTHLGKYELEDLIPFLSFTEYTLQGFSQERPIDYNDYIGKWGIFWGMDKRSVDIDHLDSIYILSEYRFKTKEGFHYRNFQPLTDEQIKSLGLE